MLIANLKDETNGRDLEVVYGTDLTSLKDNAKLRAGWFNAMVLTGMILETNIGEATFRKRPKTDGVYDITIKAVVRNNGEELKQNVKYSITLCN